MVSSCRLGSYFVILVLHSIAAAVLVTVLFTSNLPYNFIVPMLEDLSIFLHSILLFFDIGYASLCYCLLGFVIMTHFALGVFPKNVIQAVCSLVSGLHDSVDKYADVII